MTEADWRRLVEPCFARIARWQLPRPQKLLGGWIVLASFGSGRPWVDVDDQRALARLVSMDEAEVSRAISGLVSSGLLQRTRERLSDGTRLLRLRWLPNATLVQPSEEVQFALAASAADTARLAELNGWPADTEPGGQVRLDVRSIEERLAEELAVESARAVLPPEVRDDPDGDRIRAELRKQFGADVPLGSDPRSLGNSQFANWDGAGKLGNSQSAPCPLPARPGPGETSETFAEVQTHTFETSGQTGAVAPESDGQRWLRPLADSQVQYALGLVRKAAQAKAEDRAAFAQWERKWKTRCRAEPELIAEFAADEIDAQRNGRGARSATKWIFTMAKRAALEVGRSLRSVFF